MWITEFGYATTTQRAVLARRRGPKPTQADYLRPCVRRSSSRTPTSRSSYWYNLRNNFWAPEADTWEDQLGLVRAQLRAQAGVCGVPRLRAAVASCNRRRPRSRSPLRRRPRAPRPRSRRRLEQAQPEIPVRLRLTGISRRNVRGGKWTIVSVRGRVAGTAAARVQLRVAGRHRVARRTQTASTAVVDGRLTWRIRLRRGGRWRVRAIVEHSTHGRVRTAPIAGAT